MKTADKKKIQIKGWKKFDDIFCFELAKTNDVELAKAAVIEYFTNPENKATLELLLTAVCHAELEKMLFIQENEKMQELGKKVLGITSEPTGFVDEDSFDVEECKPCEEYEVCLEKSKVVDMKKFKELKTKVLH